MEGGGGGSSEGERKPPESSTPGGGGGGGGGSGGGVKRKMKNPFQLEALEKAYQVETYPSESLRAELSAQLGLTDRQLQMWFCHRRLKDRKPQSGSSGKRSKKGGEVQLGSTSNTPGVGSLPPPGVKEDGFGNELGPGSGSGSGSSPYGQAEARRGSGYTPRAGVAVPRISGHGRYYEPPSQSVAELRAIAFVEAQLGEPLREDGPALGMQFDPLPPGAFGAPIATTSAPEKPAGRAYDASVYERSDAKPIKGPGRALQEYQFLPEQPTVRSDHYERMAQSHYYGSPSDGPGTKTPPLSSGRSYMHGYEEAPTAYGGPGQLSLMALPGKPVGGPVPCVSGDYDTVARKSPYMAMGVESPYSGQPATGVENALMPSDRLVVQEDEAVRLEKKRKIDEARLAKEVEAHEKRMRKELEKQDILRRKREEQIRKDMERQDRERRKEEERLFREKQREEERYQREQRREMERREKFLLKESLRAEKMRQKEELRREREAARQKAANDRAAARRLAKESMELIEDERLELMEIATAKKNLPSILALDSDTLQNLDLFRDMLRVFPPKSVQMKKPFAVKPWMGSEENVGNLLMVWRFLITFADVLGLWPFTLDEFVQAFHDYDSRLLGELHIALLRTIIKDIEDVARTPSSGLSAAQNVAVHPAGGHPHIVEGAYSWGFDIRSWQHNLSPLTWPEILRQFALSAGFGPKLKKRNVEQTFARDDDEGNDGINIIANLRTGAAVENAVAIMRERGYSNPRRSRHRLTPGTVKFAAFHVLSLEGGGGLNIPEVAERIQKSGLRDLTTSKTPEASIAAALSRDTKLFERTAPSTYCVRSPYRKDPADAEAILSTAREKIRAFKSGFAEGVEADVDGVDVDGVEADDVEKDEDSESDTAEDPDVDDLGADLTPSKDVHPLYDLKRDETEPSCGVGKLPESGMSKTSNGVGKASKGGSSSVGFESFKELGDNGCSVEESTDGGFGCEGTNAEYEDTDIDESCPGEAWVQGLMEAEYSCLSVEERLNALSALVGVATEGNLIRLVLDERLEAATALKKQMWAEAQLDKRRFKEEYFMKTPYAMSSQGKADSNMMTPAPDSSKLSPLLASHENNSDAMMNHASKLFTDAYKDGNIQSGHSEKNFQTPDMSIGMDNLALQQSVYAVEKSRAQLKSYIGHKAEEMYVYRSLPLGQDRRRNRYWQFIASASSNDPGAGRIFVELHNGGWRLIDSEEAFDALLSSLDVRGIRESHLHALLSKVEPLFKESVRKNKLDISRDVSLKTEPSECADSPNSSLCASNSQSPEHSASIRIESGRNNAEITNTLIRFKNFEEWMWRECICSSELSATKYGKKRCTQLVCTCDSCHDVYFFEDSHCPACHQTFSAFDQSFDFSVHKTHCDETQLDRSLPKDCPPPRIRLIKALLALVETCIPHEALQPVWSEGYRKSWGMKLHMSSSAEDLLQVLTLLEGAIKRDFLSSTFQTTSELLDSGNVVGYVVNDASNFGTVTLLPWIPHTTSAVALRLMELDSAIAYIPDQKMETGKDMDAGHFIKLPSRYTVVRNIPDDELVDIHGEYNQIDAWTDLGDKQFSLTRGGRPRGRGGRPRGSRSQKRAPGSRAESSTRTLPTSEGLGQVIGGWKSRSARGKGGRKRGRRSVRSRQKPVKKAAAPVAGARSLPKPVMFEKSPPGRDEWNARDSRRMQVEEEEVDVNDESNSERSEYEDENGEEYDDVAVDGYGAVYNGKPGRLMDGRGGYNVVDDDEEDDRDDVGDDDDAEDEVDEDDDVDVDGGEYEHGEEMDVGGYLNADSEDGVPDEGQDETSDSASTDYSSDE